MSASGAEITLQPIDVAQAQAIVEGDLAGLVAGRGWPQPDTIGGLRLELARGAAPVCWLIVRDGVVVGEIGWKGGPDPDGSVEIGYAVAPHYRGNGYATGAVIALVALARRRPDVRRVVAETAADNRASRRVLEKAGFTVSSVDGGYVYWLCATAS